jgi:type IV secretion system protein TrbL
MGAEMSAEQAFQETANQVVSSATNYLGTHLEVMQGYGMNLFAGLALISIAWFGIRIVLESGQITDLFGGLLRSLMTIGLTYWFMNAGFQLVFVQGISGTLNQISSALLPGSGDLVTAVGNALGRFFQAAQAILKNLDLISPSFLNPLEAIGNLVGSISALVNLLFSAFCLAVAGAIYFVLALGTSYMVTIALIFGPIFIPWLVLSQTAWLFDGWLRFLITASLWKVVAAAIIGISDGIFAELANRVITAASKGTDNYSEITLMSLSAALSALLMGWLLLQVPSVANALVAGGAGVHGFNIHSLRNLGRNSNSATTSSNPTK